MGVWTMLFGGSSATLISPVGEDPRQLRRKQDVARRLRRTAQRCGRYAPFADRIAQTIETGIAAEGRPSSHADQARAVFLLARFLRHRGLRRAASQTMLLFVELNHLASQV